MSDGLLFFFGILFFFILWVVSGGPTRPISFTGPFITPITNEGQTQSAYGPTISLKTKISAGSASLNASANGGTTTNIPDTSPYTSKVFLTRFVNGLGGTDPAQEYLGLEVANNVSGSINVSGWKVISAISGANATIPQGVQMLQLGTVTLQPIMLKAGYTATITTGKSPVSVSFEQNTCANYLAQAQNYSQCFSSHSNDTGFLTGIWRIYLSKGARLWKNSGDIIELEDSDGKVVDSFAY